MFVVREVDELISIYGMIVWYYW